MHARAAALACLALTGCLTTYQYPPLVSRAAEAPGGVLFHDVRVFAATGEQAVEHQDVLVQSGKIVSVGPTGAALPNGAKVIEGADKTLLPGLVELHGHLTSTAAPPWHLTNPDPVHIGQSYLYCGVTTVYDVAGDLDQLEDIRAHEARGEWLGPHFTYSGPMITPEGGYPASMMHDLFIWPLSMIAAKHFATEIATPAEAEAAVEHRKQHGAHHIKVAVAQIPLEAPIYDPVLLKAVVDASHARGMKVVAHIDTEAHALIAVRAGVDALVHLVQLGPLSAEAAKELADRHVPVVLTLVAFDRMEQLHGLRYQPSPIETRMVPKELLAEYSPESVTSHTISPGMEQWIRALEKSHDERMENVKRLIEAGVTILVGSDGEGSAATWAGGAYLEELKLMVAAGVPPAQVLLGATSRAAALIDAAPDYGTIEPGKRADLLLVNGNPLEDLDLGERIVAVMEDGRLIDRLNP